MKAHIGEGLDLDIDKLIESRLLIQANSGGGKSRALRKILEATHGHVQQIVLDIDGEFASLREKYDFILAGKGGDIEASPDSASMLCRKILELKADLIVDLYELRQPERIEFVKNFLESMVDMPKELWQPVLVVLDEAHIFAPEKSKAESLSAVIDIATRGRKRGYCIVMATQRLSKLHKDAAAECNNKMIGRTGLDIDVKRAMDELGLRDGSELKKLKPGEFFCYGPAISTEVFLTRTGDVKTAHAVRGKLGKSRKPAPSAKVKKVLSQFTELVAEAEQEQYNLASLQKENRDLKMHIKSVEFKAKNSAPVMPARDIQKKARQVAELSVVKVRQELETHMTRKFLDLKNNLNEVLADFSVEPKKLRKLPVATKEPVFLVSTSHAQAAIAEPKKKSTSVRHSEDYSTRVDQVKASDLEGDKKLGACERKILGFLQTNPRRGFSYVQVGAMTGYKHGAGAFNNAVGRLHKLGLILRERGQLQVTIEGEKIDLGGETPHTLQDWISKLGKCERLIYSEVLKYPAKAFAQEEIAQLTGYTAGTGGFNNAIGRLSTLGLIRRESGTIKLNEELVTL